MPRSFRRLSSSELERSIGWPCAWWPNGVRPGGWCLPTCREKFKGVESCNDGMVIMAGDGERQDGSTKPNWQVTVDERRCSVCEVCGQRCPTNAIRSEQTDGKLALLFDYELCDGCRDCLQYCPEDAMAIVEASEPPEDTSQKILASTNMLLCTVCGAHFAPVTKLDAATRRRGPAAALIREQCPLCRRTQMVARFIEEHRNARGRKAEYQTGKKWRWKPVVEGDPDAPPCPQEPRASSGQHPPTPPPSGEGTSDKS